MQTDFFGILPEHILIITGKIFAVIALALALAFTFGFFIFAIKNPNPLVYFGYIAIATFLTLIPALAAAVLIGMARIIHFAHQIHLDTAKTLDINKAYWDETHPQTKHGKNTL